MMMNVKGVKCVLLDIEGTICPIAFVKETLFPYALKALPDVLASKWNHEAFKPYLDAFPETVRSSPADLQAHVEDLTKRDVKIASLKNLQGYLWENGYKTGAYSTPLFPDVAPRLKKWKTEGFQLAIYSSGSVFAQKLLFEHVNTVAATTQKRKSSNQPESRNEEEEATFGPPSKKRASETKNAGAGDGTIVESNRTDNHEAPEDQITGMRKSEYTSVEAEHAARNLNDHDTSEDLQYLITGWFDTTNAGLKTEKISYEKIADRLKVPPTDILFLSDNVKELDAALAAGMHAIMVDRPGNAPLSESDKDRLSIVHSLNEIKLAQKKTDSNTKRLQSKKPSQRQSQRLKAKFHGSK